MKVVAILPARLQATRFPRKLLQDLCGKPVIVRTYEAVVKTGLFDKVLVATDDDEIKSAISNAGGQVFISKLAHECGSDRIAEAAENLDADIILNVQGDEPFTNQDDLKRLINVFEKDREKSISLASIKHQLHSEEDISNPNNVKVITDLAENAIYFSRSPIPFLRDATTGIQCFKHVGIYAFRKEALLDFYHSKPTPLEMAEKIECLRYLEQGKKIRMVTTDHLSIGIDTPSDLEAARKKWKTL